MSDVKNMKIMMNNILNHYRRTFTDKQNTINILEIGTGMGDGTTQYLYDYFTELNKEFVINSYEGVVSCYNWANSIWENTPNVHIHNKFFCDKEDVKNIVIPNIIDDNPPLTKEHYFSQYKESLELDNYETSIEYTPDIIIIDSWRFSHAAIINMCKNYSNKETLFIVEEDYPHPSTNPIGSEKAPPQYPIGWEQTCIQKMFNVQNIEHFPSKYHDCFNFFSFTLK